MRTLKTTILTVIHAAFLVSVQTMAAEPRARDSQGLVYQLVGQTERASGADKHSAGQAGAKQTDRTDRTDQTTPAGTVPKAQKVGCDCVDCKCADELICKRGDCKKNYAIFFTASWCRYCKDMYPSIRELRDEGHAIYIFDVDKFKKAGEMFNVGSLPTVVVMDKGKEVKRFTGVTSKEAILKHLKLQNAAPKNPDYKL